MWRWDRHIIDNSCDTLAPPDACWAGRKMADTIYKSLLGVFQFYYNTFRVFL